MLEQNTVQIYVYLEGEGTDVWRPVEALLTGVGEYRIVGQPVDGEVWQFDSGDVVKCRKRETGKETILVAYERANQ